MIVVTVRFQVKAGAENDFLERALNQARVSRDRESHCLQFDVAEDPSDPRRIFLYELYASAVAFADHLLSPPFLAFDRDTRPLIDSKVVERWELRSSR